jgi:hypothetical protein
LFGADYSKPLSFTLGEELLGDSQVAAGRVRRMELNRETLIALARWARTATAERIVVPGYRIRFLYGPISLLGKFIGGMSLLIIHAAHSPWVKNRQDKRGRYQSSTRIINGVGDQKARDS